MNSDAEKIIAWAKNRADYVKPINSVRWCLKDSSKFGRNFRGNLTKGDGDLFESNWWNLTKLRPICLEIAQSPNPFVSFVEKLRKSDESFFADLFYFGINETSLNVEDICFVVESAEKLSIFEYSGVDSNDFERLLTSLQKKNCLKAINFQCLFTVAQIHRLMKELKFKIRIGEKPMFFFSIELGKIKIRSKIHFSKATINLLGECAVRFCGSPGLDLSEFMKIRDEFPCVELLALQDFNFRVLDDENVEQIDPKKFFNKIYRVFPNLKMFYMDWRIVDVVCLYDERTASFCAEIEKLYKFFKLQFVAVLIYCPTEEMKQSAVKIQEYFQKENETEQLKVRLYEFSLNLELNDHPNFSLIVFGEFHYQARTKRLIELIVDGRETNLDLRHLCYVVDQDNLLYPDVSIEFGGFDPVDVAEKYRQSDERDYFSAADAVDRCFTGSSG